MDAMTRKLSIIGVFDSFNVSVFPGMTSKCTAYVQLVDGIGRYALTVEIHDLREGIVLAKLPPVPMEFPERVNKVNIMIGIPPFPLPHEGAYDFVVYADDQVIDRQRFEALPVRSQGDGNDIEQGDSNPESD